ncbi:DUF2975 domain-containing protein [Olivibacter sp. SDN3]|uniref:DUF2975 domain-containing protein n=1 Tax=Olivibacter sp. SDN3 TaxID=2764720 RepID=UPI001651229C|nr:DUF2975 domain-containing protein [Olivibacter sp. SDN3]QNL51869.1 DUF2975 domain-containing protein [Olivibacter sp. SDN3]
MKRISIIFLRVVVVLIGIGTLAFLLWEPHIEGRNIHATFFDIYFKDPFLIYVYIASASFFVGLYQVFKLLGYIGQNSVFSQNTVRALRTIKYCSIILIIFILGAEAYFFIVQSSKGEDIAGGVAIGFVMIFISLIIATAATLFEKILQNAVDMKSENDLTI